MDLSFPHGMTVNTNISKDFYLGIDFILTLPSIDHITNKIKQLGKGSLLYKVDISRAFRHRKIDPRDFFVRLKAQKLLYEQLSAFRIQKQIQNFSETQRYYTVHYAEYGLWRHQYN